MLIVYLFLYKPLAIKTDSHLIGSDFRIIFNQCENSKWKMKDKGKFERGPKVWFVGDVRSAMHTELQVRMIVTSTRPVNRKIALFVYCLGNKNHS